MSLIRLLLVDDEPSLRMTLAANLELEGFEVVEAKDGEEALRLAKESQFDLVLTDIRMPGMSGVDLFRQLRQQEVNAPVILMTAFAMEGLVQSALEEGAYTVLPKPFDIGHVIHTLTLARQQPLVLVVDDMAGVAQSTALAVEAVGLSSQAVTSAAQALEVIEHGQVDVCVIDMIMPEMNGAELVEVIKKKHPHLIVIAVSGHDVPDLVNRVIAAGAVTFMNKPFEMPELVRTIAKARGQKRNDGASRG